MGIDALITLGGILVPPVFDFIKKKFIKAGKDTPEATMSALATTKPETLAPYVQAMTGYIDAQIRFFNRDVVGTLPPWVSALRATIRPLVVVFGILHILLHGMFGDAFVLEEGIRFFYEANIGAWFGSRMVKD